MLPENIFLSNIIKESKKIWRDNDGIMILMQMRRWIGIPTFKAW